MSLRTGRRSGDGRANKSRLVIYAGVGLAIIVIWTILILVLGVGSHGPGADGKAGSPGKQPPGALTNGQQTGRAAGSAPTAPQPENNGGTRVLSETPGGAHDAVRPKNPRKFIQQERARDRKASGQPPLPAGGATDEPSGYDPLGIKHKRIPLTPTYQSRVKAAASEFVIAAYGYSGKDRNQYIKNLNRQVITDTFYSSPGDKEIEIYLNLIESRGTKSAAKLTGFQFANFTEGEVTGYAYFSTADSYDRYGNLIGAKKNYRQQLVLVRSGAVFAVKSASRIQEVRNQ